MKWLARKAVRHPWLFICAGLLVIGVLALGNLRLSLSYDTRIYFYPQNPRLHDLIEFDQKYSQNNNVLFVVYRGGEKITEPEGLRAVAALTERAWQLPHSSKVDSLTNFPTITADAGSFTVRELVQNPQALTASQAADIERTAKADPLIINRFLGPEGTAAGVNVNFTLPPKASDEVVEIIDASRALAASIEQEFPGTTVKVTGNVILMGTFSEAVLSDLLLLIPISLSLTGFMMLVFLRSFNALTAIVSVLSIAAMTATGIAGWYGIVLAPASSAAPLIIMTLSMAAAVHVVTTVMIERAKGQPLDTAIDYAIQENARPITLTSVTTLIGFLALNSADAPPLDHLGNMVAVGIIVGYLLIFLWLPAVMKILPPPPMNDGSRHVMAGIGRFVNRSYKALIVGTLSAMVLVGTGLRYIELDDDFVRYFDNRFDYRQASDFAEQHLTGLNMIEFDLDAGSDGGVYDPAYQKKVEAFAAWLKTRPGVVSVNDITEITRRIHEAMNAGAEGDYRQIPDDRELISQYFLMYELSLPYGADITDVINVSRSSSRVTALLRGLTSAEIKALDQDAQQWLDAHAPDMADHGIGINVLFAYMSVNNIKSMVGGTAITYILISLIVGLALRSVKLGIISMGTNTLPVIIGFGIWGYTIGVVGLDGAVITAMTLGLVVDDTIHFLSKYKQARDLGQETAGAVEYAFGACGIAMFITTISLFVGFSLLLLSGYQTNVALGAQTAIIILVALAIDWLMVPPLLRIFDAKRALKSPS